MQTTKPETAQQRPTGARMALLMLLYFIKIGAFTFGSGWSIIAQMEREFVDERGWMDQERSAGAHRRGQEPARHHGGEHHCCSSAIRWPGRWAASCAAIGLCIPAVVTLTIVTAIYDAHQG